VHRPRALLSRPSLPPVARMGEPRQTQPPHTPIDLSRRN
jgi:hypothetical protein